MGFGYFAMWIVAGLIVGVLAEFVVKDGGHGLKRDLSLGVAGSVAAGVFFVMLGALPDLGLVGQVVVGTVGAVVALLAQRKIWPVDEPKFPVARRS